ncbi:MAG: hypothetical protein IT383_26795 [Deltaproteobacteria bacterium]|nr:hypothetical protein [Deltaproteobacteria bacterium]
MRAIIITGALVLGAASCGFDCEVQGEPRPFASCEALQEAYDAEQSRLDQQPSGQVLDELLVCGAAHGCDLQP